MGYMARALSRFLRQAKIVLNCANTCGRDRMMDKAQWVKSGHPFSNQNLWNLMRRLRLLFRFDIRFKNGVGAGLVTFAAGFKIIHHRLFLPGWSTVAFYPVRPIQHCSKTRRQVGNIAKIYLVVRQVI